MWRIALIILLFCGFLPASTRCFAQNSVAALQGTLRSGLEKIRSGHSFKRVWLRLEQPGEAPVEVATTGTKAGDSADIASLSKSVTAIGIAILIQQGKLRLDSKLGDLLPSYFAKRGITLDSSLRSITIERLLTHRAGLRTNWTTDPVNGIPTRKITDQTGGSAHFFKFIVAADAAKSNGSDKFLYSNISYLILGMVIEATSGESYHDFCQRNIIHPLGISATIPAYLNVVAPFSGWQMNLGGILKVWSVFEIDSPTILTKEALKDTLLGGPGGPTKPNSNLYYTMGVYLRQDNTNGPYVLSHNGNATLVRGAPTFYTFVEKFVPGHGWALAAAPAPERNFSDVSRAVASDVRHLLDGALDAR